MRYSTQFYIENTNCLRKACIIGLLGTQTTFDIIVPPLSKSWD